MRYVLSVLLLPALVSPALAQDNEAEKLFRAMEKKTQAAKAIQLPVPAAAFGLDLGFPQVAAYGPLVLVAESTPFVTDARLKELTGLKNLQTLNLYGTLVTDAGLTELAGLKNLKTLSLGGTKVTD